MANIKDQKGAQMVEETISTQEAFFLKYKKAIIYGVVAIVVVIAGIIVYNNYVAGPREDKASTILAKGQQLFGEEQFEKALKGDGANFPGLLSIASDYSSTDAGNLAKLYAGLSYAFLGKDAEALKYLNDYSPANDAMVSPAAIAARGNVYAKLGKLDEAVKDLKKAADMADSKAKNGRNYSIAPTFLLQAGQILESQGKKEEAAKIYKDIKANYVNAMVVQSQEIDKYIERATLK